MSRDYKSHDVIFFLVTESIEHDSMKKSEISAFFKPLTEKTYNSGPHKTKNKTESQTYEEYCEENVIDKSAETTEDSSDNEPIQRAVSSKFYIPLFW